MSLASYVNLRMSLKRDKQVTVDLSHLWIMSDTRDFTEYFFHIQGFSTQPILLALYKPEKEQMSFCGS